MSTLFHDPSSVTVRNLETAFAGEAVAHIKYRYFARLCRAAGDEATARVFEETAEQEVMHAFGHADLLFPAAKVTPAKALELAIEGETCEYTEMYPSFRHAAVAGARARAVADHRAGRVPGRLRRSEASVRAPLNGALPPARLRCCRRSFAPP